jgi:hypothetical protein
MRALHPVRVVGIPPAAVAVPPRATRMAHSKRTAEDDQGEYSFASTIECRTFWALREGILWGYIQEGIDESQAIIPILVILALAAGFILVHKY